VIPAFRRAAVVRPAAAEMAAQGLRLALPSAVAAEVRWAFTPPRSWLSGVAANLVLALVWLLLQPLQLPRHHDWVILIGTYFSSFILADVTTTNLLGNEHIRVRMALHDGVLLWRVLLVKEPGAGRDRRPADSCCGDGHDALARNTRTACGDDSQRRGADRVLARGRKPGVGAVSCRRRATGPSLRYWATRVAVSSTSESRRPSGLLRPPWRCCSPRGAAFGSRRPTNSLNGRARTSPETL
jgi:hypothetical protein